MVLFTTILESELSQKPVGGNFNFGVNEPLSANRAKRNGVCLFQILFFFAGGRNFNLFTIKYIIFLKET